MTNVPGGSLELAEEERADVRPGGPARTHHNRPDRREQTRTALLAAARRLWAERGIHGASLDDVAAAAGLTKGAVYSNFAGKTDLLLALLERLTQSMVGLEAEIHSALHARDASREERLGRASEAYTRHLAGEDTRLAALLMMEFWLYGARHHTAGWRLADWYESRRAALADGLAETDGMSPDDRAALAMALDMGLAMQHLLDPDRVPLELHAKGMEIVLGPALR